MGLAASAEAESTTYTIPDVGTFAAYVDSNSSDTFAGTGYVGIYTSHSGAAPSFAHLFGLEYYNGVYSETEMQVNISGLSGVTSAILSYNLLNGAGESQYVTVTSFTSTGLLRLNTTPKNNLGSTTFISTGLSANSVDVTSLLQNAIAAGQTWFGLYLTPNGSDTHQWTFTWPRDGYNADSATVRLTITTVPEPGTVALASLGAASLLIFRRLHKR